MGTLICLHSAQHRIQGKVQSPLLQKARNGFVQFQVAEFDSLIRAVPLECSACTGDSTKPCNIVRAMLGAKLKRALHHSYHYFGSPNLVQIYEVCIWRPPPLTTNNADFAMRGQIMSMRRSSQFRFFRRPIIIPERCQSAQVHSDSFFWDDTLRDEYVDQSL
jgi:hypothetical protein